MTIIVCAGGSNILARTKTPIHLIISKCVPVQFFCPGLYPINSTAMATKGKTRGPKEGKYVKKATKEGAKSETRKKRTEKQVGAKKRNKI